MTRRSRLGLEALYARSLLATMGVPLVGAPALLWIVDASRSRTWSTTAVLIGGSIAVAGLLLITVSILARDRTASRWAEAWSVHEAVLVPMLLAWPLYRVLKALLRR